jgi:drug/metabolite transporter (DMT)-like permease
VTTWLGLAIGAQFINAISVIVDRHIVVRAEHIGKPIVYAFYVSLMSGFVVVIAPFGFIGMPSMSVALYSLAQAFAFVGAIFCLYSALRVTRASDAAPVVGAISAITSLVLAGIFIESDITLSLVPSVMLLVAGTALISHFHFRGHAFRYALFSGVLFGTSIVLAKMVYLETAFLDGFFWTRTMCIVASAALLLVPAWRHSIFHGGKRSSKGAKALVVGNKLLAGAAGVMTALAVSLGSVSIVNALAGLQFVFLFAFAFLFAEKMPFTKVKTGSHGGWQTGFGVSLIVIGLAVIYLSHVAL